MRPVPSSNRTAVTFFAVRSFTKCEYSTVGAARGLTAALRICTARTPSAADVAMKMPKSAAKSLLRIITDKVFESHTKGMRA